MLRHRALSVMASGQGLPVVVDAADKTPLHRYLGGWCEPAERGRFATVVTYLLGAKLVVQGQQKQLPGLTTTTLVG